MIIDSSDFLSIPGITQATLTENSDAPSVLNLSWAGFGPDWLRWMEPVTIMHRGRVLFHGRMNNFDRTNAAGSLESSATVVNALWLLDNLPLGAQVAEAKAASESSGVDFAAAGQNALMSWTALADSCRVSAPLWVVNESGEPQENAIITLDVSCANYSTAAVYKRDKVMTAWTALLEMKQANPDALFRMNYTTGEVEVVSIGGAVCADWSTDAMQLASAASIAPQYESCITGVALVVSWQGKDGGRGGSTLKVYPSDVDAGDMGVKVYTAQVENAAQATAQAEYMMRQLKQYYEAVNVLQYGGSVTVLLEDIAASPLCNRLNIVGTGTHESWHTMNAVVSGVVWDFLAGTVEAQLGAQIDEPDISEMTFPDDAGEGELSSTYDEPPDIPDDFTTEEDDSTWDDSTTWEYTTTWNPDFSWSEESTTTWDFTTTWDDTTTWGDSTTQTGSTGDTETATSGTTPGTGGTDVPPLPSWDSDSASASTTWTGTSTATSGSASFSTSGTSTRTATGSGSGSAQGSEPGGTSGSEPGGGCDCAEKWKAYEQRISALEARVAVLESLHRGGSSDTETGSDGTSGCGCECAGLLEAIQQAVQAAAAGVSLTAEVNQSVMTTNTGNLQVRANASASGGSGASSVNFHY